MNKIFLFLAVCLLCFSCARHEELSLEELEGFSPEGLEQLLARTVSKPWRGEEFLPGKIGGSWFTAITTEPKSFNHLIAEQDGTTRAVVARTIDYFLDYDYLTREWKPRIISAQITVDEEADTMQVVCTLRDDLYWSYYNYDDNQGNAFTRFFRRIFSAVNRNETVREDRKIKVTTDDIIFWYDEIEGDREMGSSGYYGQFMLMPDGTEERITISKIDDYRFVYHFPRITAEPLLAINNDFGPRHIYEPAKRQGGVEGVKNLFSVAVDPRTIPSMGQWFLVEYSPGQRLVYKRNPDYWNKDINDNSIPYVEELVIRIIPEENTQMHLFLNGQIEHYSLRPEDLEAVVNRKNANYTVFNSEGAINSAFWTFNQNPVNSSLPQYDWFTKKEFRQAMSCLLNRDRINTQVYRGLAEPKLSVFPQPNPYYDPQIALQYLFDRDRALALLSSIGIARDTNGNMRDSLGRQIEFDLSIASGSTVAGDIASIMMDELSRVGIKLNIRVMDFQLQVQQLFETFDWDSTIMSLSGSGVFPSQGSNTWPSSGNLHMWHPNQESPASEWEARIDYLYYTGMTTVDKEKAKEIWDEFQSIILEQCPLIYLMRSRRFWAINNRWNLSNVYFDNLFGAETEYVFLK